MRSCSFAQPEASSVLPGFLLRRTRIHRQARQLDAKERDATRERPKSAPASALLYLA